MYILIKGGMLGWKYNFMINSMQFYSINAKKAKAGGAVIEGYVRQVQIKEINK